MLLIKKLHHDAIIPTRGSSFAVGLDLYAVEDAVIMCGRVTKVHTGIAIAFPETHYARIAPRSGLAFKEGVHTMAGVVDCDYRGEIVVGLTKLTDYPGKMFQIRKGERIAQLIMERADIMPVYEVGALPETARGVNGFGSTGL